VRHIAYTSYDRSFTLKESPKLASYTYMSFGKRITLSGLVSVKAEALNLNTIHSNGKHLSKEDYKVQFLNTKLIQKNIRIAMMTEKTKHLNKINIVAKFQGGKS